MDLFGKVMSLPFNMLSSFVMAFLPRSKRLLISWLQSLSAVILEHQKIKSDTVSTVSRSICPEVMGQDAMMLVFWMLSFKPSFSLSSFTFIKKLFSSSSLSAIRVVSSAYLKVKVKMKSLSRVWLFATPWTVAHQAPQSMGFPRQEYWSGVTLSTSWETLGYKKHKLESRLPGEISIASDMQMTTPLWQKVKRN